MGAQQLSSIPDTASTRLCRRIVRAYLRTQKESQSEERREGAGNRLKHQDNTPEDNVAAYVLIFSIPGC